MRKHARPAGFLLWWRSLWQAPPPYFDEFEGGKHVYRNTKMKQFLTLHGAAAGDAVLVKTDEIVAVSCGQMPNGVGGTVIGRLVYTRSCGTFLVREELERIEALLEERGVF